MNRYIFVIILICTLLFSVVSSSQPNSIDLFGLLKARDYKGLEVATRQIQVDFEHGKLSEFELREVYRSFYNLDTQALNNTQEWVIMIPNSYAAHLIRGIYFKRTAWKARGNKSIADTPEANIVKMRQHLATARTELTTSLKLTKKPYLSVFHLLDVVGAEGKIETASKHLEFANKMLPSNTLVRNRYMHYLTPRWGGSYAQMNGFLAKSKAEGISTAGILQLEAIIYDDRGFTLVNSGDKHTGVYYFELALERASRVGGDFRKDCLLYSSSYSCSEPALRKYCE